MGRWAGRWGTGMDGGRRRGRGARGKGGEMGRPPPPSRPRSPARLPARPLARSPARPPARLRGAYERVPAERPSRFELPTRGARGCSADARARVACPSAGAPSRYAHPLHSSRSWHVSRRAPQSSAPPVERSDKSAAHFSPSGPNGHAAPDWDALASSTLLCRSLVPSLRLCSRTSALSRSLAPSGCRTAPRGHPPLHSSTPPPFGPPWAPVAPTHASALRLWRPRALRSR